MYVDVRAVAKGCARQDSCLATGSTAQERNARRQEEIESLKEARE